LKIPENLECRIAKNSYLSGAFLYVELAI